MEPLVITVDERFDELVEEVADQPAVFLIYSRDPAARPYLARTKKLRRRLKRLLRKRDIPSRTLDLRPVAERVECHFSASELAASILFYEFASRHYPDDSPRLTRLRPATWVKVLLSNEFPRTMVTTQLSASKAMHYGPFRNRAGAERFEQEVLDLFQVRRCQEDLLPAPDHPGCIYGEMARCCRPCQMVVGPDEYRTEVERLTTFLDTDGKHLLDSIASLRDRFSEEMDYEEAARQHQRYQKVELVVKLRDELATELSHLCGVAVLPSLSPGCVELRYFLRGAWLPPIEFQTAASSGEMVPLDRRLRDAAAPLEEPRLTIRERTYHVALLVRWFYSTWRDGEWISFSSLAEIPYRRLVRAVSRVAVSTQQWLFDSGQPPAC